MRPLPALLIEAAAGLAALCAAWFWPAAAVAAAPALAMLGLILAWAVRVRQRRETRALRAVMQGEAGADVDPWVKNRIEQWRHELLEALTAQREADEQLRHLEARNAVLEATARDAQLTLLGARAELDQLREGWPQRQLARALERARAREQRAALVRALQPGLEDMTRLAQSSGCRPQSLQMVESLQLQGINARLALERGEPATVDTAAACEALSHVNADAATLADQLRGTSEQDRRAMLDAVDAMRAAVDLALRVAEPDEADLIPPEIDRLALDLRRATLQLASAMRSGDPADERARLPEDQG